MRIVTPSRSQISSLQERDVSYYFSRAADVVLRKLGITLDDDGVVLVSRETPWKPTFKRASALFEGCLSDSVSRELGIGCERHRTQQLSLVDDEEQPLGALLYHRPILRKIPSSRGEESEPFPFASDDPFWNCSAFDFQALDDGEGTPLLFGVDQEGTRSTVGLRLGRAVVLGIPLFDVLVQQHSCPPYEAGYYTMQPESDLLAAEAWLLERITELGPVSRSPLWPERYRAALTIRHDYDRPLQRTEVRTLLDFYGRRSLRSSWFWRLCHIDRNQVNDVTNSGHEVALHTEASTESSFRDELKTFEQQLGFKPAGYSAHGGIPAPGHLGLHQLEWAIEADLSYGEKLVRSGHKLAGGHALPHQAVVIRGRMPTTAELIIPGQHRGLDTSTAPDGHRLAALGPEVRTALDRGEHCVVMSHPDIHREMLQGLLAALDLNGVWLATLADVADWFRRSRLGVTNRLSTEE